MHSHGHPGVVQHEISNRKTLKKYSKWLYISRIIPKALTRSTWNNTNMKSV